MVRHGLVTHPWERVVAPRDAAELALAGGREAHAETRGAHPAARTKASASRCARRAVEADNGDALRGLLIGTPSHIALDLGVLLLSVVIGVATASSLVDRLAR